MFRRSNHSKSYKEKLRDLKDLLNGKQSLETLVRANLPPRTITIFNEGDGYYVDKPTQNKMTKEELDEWLEKEKEKGPIGHIIYFEPQDGNEPLKDTEVTYSEETFPDGLVWKEGKTYDKPANKIDKIIQVQDPKGRQIEIQVIKSRT